MARGWIVGLLGVIILFAAGSTLLIGGVIVDRYTSTPAFCGNTCHVMKAAYESWKVSEHKDINCLACHATTGEKPSRYPSFRGLRQAYSYVMRESNNDNPRVRPVINDQSCAAAGCHTGEHFLKKESSFAKSEGVRFIHISHKVKDFDGSQDSPEAAGAPQAASVPGHELHCDTCHTHQSVNNHFEVAKETCFLCHFKKQGFNEGRATCMVCHDLPHKSLQQQKAEDDEGAITHDTIFDAGVPCQSCHRHVIAGSGAIKKEDCRTCHFKPEILAKSGRGHMELLHRKHVAGQQAGCFDCHQPIEHKDRDDFLDLVRSDCQACHPDHHKFQKALLVGAEREGVPHTPNPMFSVKTNCLGCHVEKDAHKGQPFLLSSENACVACHSQSIGNLLVKWRKELAEELAYAREVEGSAVQAITDAEHRVPEAKLKHAKALLAKGRESLHIVMYGNGIHNKKYAILLLDAAIGNFDHLVEVLKEQ